MPRDRLLTAAKLDRAQGALDELLACADLEFRGHFAAARRAVDTLRYWQGGEAAAVAADPDTAVATRDEARDLAEPLPLTDSRS